MRKMYMDSGDRSSQGVRGHRPLLASVTASFVIAGVFVLLTGAGNCSASVFPKLVDGYVFDVSGVPIPDANVTIRIYDGVTLKGTQYYDATENDGFYTVTFDGPQWDPGNEIEVTARYDLESAQNSTTADDEPFQSVNVTMSLAIPEFGSLLGSPILGLSLGMVAIFAVSARLGRR